MKKTVFTFSIYPLWLLIIASCTSLALGQRSKECDLKDLQRPKFKIAFVSAGEILRLDAVVKLEYQTDENLILLAKFLRQRYCNESIITATVFDNKKDAREFTIYEIKQIPDTLRAIYHIDRNRGQEYLVRIKVIDNKQVETPIRLD